MAEAPSILGRRIAISGLILVLLRLSLKVIGLISTVVLFRLLLPEDFGIVALAMLVVGFVEVFAEFGFDQNLLRTRDVGPNDYHLVWSMNLVRGVIVGAAILAGAPLAAHFLEEPRLVQVVAFLAVLPLLDGVQSVGVVDFAKNLQFQREFKLKVSQKLISFVVTLIAALVLRNYWALVVGLVAGRLAGLVLGYAMHPYRPRFMLEGWRRFMKFSIWILASNIIQFGGNQTDKVVVQREFGGAQTVGIVRIAEEVSGMVMELVWPVERALYAGYVTVSNDIARFRQTILNGMGLVSALGVPVALGLGLFAEPAVLLLLGENGRAAIPLVQVFVLHGALRSCLCGVMPAFLVLNRPEINTQLSFAYVAVRLGVLMLGLPFLGLMAVPWSMVAGTAVSFLLVCWRSTTVIGLPAWAIPAAMWRVFMAVGAMLAVGHLALGALRGVVSGPVQLLLLVPACGAVYLLSLVLLWMIAGRPAGGEQVAVDYVKGWLERRRKPGYGV